MTGFSEWTRIDPRVKSNLGYAMLDVDWVWHQWLARHDRIGARTVNHLMIIEEKAHGADLSDSQRDTMLIVDQALRFADEKRLVVRTLRGDRLRVRYWGYFKLRYSGTRPDTSEWIRWNHRQITLDQLVGLLRYELHPRTLRPMDDRRHHPPKVCSPLFAGVGA